MDAVANAYDKKVDKSLLIRRFNVTASNVLPKNDVDKVLAEAPKEPVQLDIFTNYELEQKQQQLQDEQLNKELEIEKVMLAVKKKFGKNAILRGMNLSEGATMKERNSQIGGHKA